MPDTASAAPRGLRTVIYKVPDLGRAKAWYTALLQRPPYFDEPYYVGYDVGGYELGLDPDTAGLQPGNGGSVAYWGVTDLAGTLALLTASAVTVHSPLREVGDGIKVASLEDPFGNIVGLIENPHFTLPDTAA